MLSKDWKFPLREQPGIYDRQERKEGAEVQEERYCLS